jgi:predicted ribosomally synthesized peptide with SipW-like signal peptide
MTEEIELPRRKILAGLGAVGVGSAAGGMGTTAFFSDTESFQGNTMVAGELDLLVDWTEHYSDWMGAETDVTVSMTDPNDDSYTPVPTADFPQLWVQDKDEFQNKTSIEAFPDTGNNGIQDVIPSDNECDYINGFLTDSGEWISPLASSGRTNGTVEGQETSVTVGDVEASDPLINLQDVKPGDFGEVTFSLHLCDNPGYIWMNGSLDTELTSENGVNEPEADDEDEDQNQDGSLKDPDGDTDGKTVELLNELRAVIWYDFGTDYDSDGYPWEGPYSDDSAEGDNVQQNGEPNLVGQGSLKAVLDALNTGMHGIGLDATPTNGSVQIPSAGPSDGSDPGNTEFGSTRYEKPQQGIVDCAAIDDDSLSVRKIDAPNLPVGGNVQTYSTSAGMVAIQGFGNDDGQPYTIAFDSEFPVVGVLIKGGPDSLGWTPVGQTYSTGTDGFEYDFSDDTYTSTEEVKLGAPDEKGISNVQFCIIPDGDDDNGEVPPLENGRDCFQNSTTASIGFAWWLPVDHANEIQTDTVAFDLGFYTEQCRHNDGSGQPPEGS